MLLLDEIAKYLHDGNELVFDEEGILGNIFIATIPTVPEVVVALYPTGGGSPEGDLPYLTPSVQIYVRGTKDPRIGMSMAQDIYNKLQGFHHERFIENGTWILSCKALQSFPIHIGIDGNERHEYTLNFVLEILNN